METSIKYKEIIQHIWVHGHVKKKNSLMYPKFQLLRQCANVQQVNPLFTRETHFSLAELKLDLKPTSF
jgi:hypothetical protein